MIEIDSSRLPATYLFKMWVDGIEFMRGINLNKEEEVSMHIRAH